MVTHTYGHENNHTDLHGGCSDVVHVVVVVTVTHDHKTVLTDWQDVVVMVVVVTHQ